MELQECNILEMAVLTDTSLYGNYTTLFVAIFLGVLEIFYLAFFFTYVTAIYFPNNIGHANFKWCFQHKIIGSGRDHISRT